MILPENGCRLVWLLIVGFALGSGCQDLQSESLAGVQEKVSRAHPVEEMEGEALSDSLDGKTSRKRIVLFDVRQTEEFETSHLEGAIAVDPDVEVGAFLAQHGSLLKDRTAVFYCSVGYRSSILVEKLVEETGDSTRLVNLRGGIFRWYNEGRAVRDSAGARNSVHPYNEHWGRLLVERRGR